MTCTKYIFLLLAFCLAASCNKEKTEPKHINVVTATINGKPWKAGCKESFLFGFTLADLQYYTNTGTLEFGASNIARDSSIGIRLWGLFNIGNYIIPPNIPCATFDKKDPCGWQEHYINENDPQEIEIISINKEKKIIEGRFSFIGRDTNCLSEPVHVTNGYFKVIYRP